MPPTFSQATFLQAAPRLLNLTWQDRDALSDKVRALCAFRDTVEQEPNIHKRIALRNKLSVYEKELEYFLCHYKRAVYVDREFSVALYKYVEACPVNASITPSAAVHAIMLEQGRLPHWVEQIKQRRSLQTLSSIREVEGLWQMIRRHKLLRKSQLEGAKTFWQEVVMLVNARNAAVRLNLLDCIDNSVKRGTVRKDEAGLFKMWKEGHSAKDIAKVSGLSLATVYRRINKWKEN